jgi:hypothetical protein
MRFTQDKTPTCSRARIAAATVDLAQPAASAIASCDGKHLALAALWNREPIQEARGAIRASEGPSRMSSVLCLHGDGFATEAPQNIAGSLHAMARFLLSLTAMTASRMRKGISWSCAVGHAHPWDSTSHQSRVPHARIWHRYHCSDRYRAPAWAAAIPVCSGVLTPQPARASLETLIAFAGALKSNGQKRSHSADSLTPESIRQRDERSPVGVTFLLRQYLDRGSLGFCVVKLSGFEPRASGRARPPRWSRREHPPKATNKRRLPLLGRLSIPVQQMHVRRSSIPVLS